MSPLPLICCILILCGVAVQIASIAYSQVRANSATAIRYVSGNEFALFWSAMAGLLVSWTATHIVVKAHRDGARERGYVRILWLRVGALPQAILWSIYILAATTFSVGTSALMFKQLPKEQPICVIFISMFPLTSAVAALPRLYGNLRLLAILQREANTRCTNAKEKIIDNASICSNATHQNTCSDNPRSSPRKNDDPGSAGFGCGSGGDSLESKPKGRPCDRFKNSGRSFPPFRLICELEAQIPSSEFQPLSPEAAPSIPTQISVTLRRVLDVLGAIFTCSSLATSMALASITISALLYWSTLKQHQHLSAAPTNYGTLVSVKATYPDHVDRTVKLAISCKGQTHMPSSDDEEIPPQQATILIEHPLGYPSLVSRSLQRELISRGHHVCIYDRPGYMLSPQGYVPMPPRTLQQAFTGALYDSGESGPFYIVGQHSGSEYAHLFAHENSGSVVGLSFIHPTDASLDALMWKEMPAETRHNITSLINKGDVASDNEHPLADLNTQRVSAALGIGLPNAPTLPNVYDDQALAEWTYSNPNMGQAQFFEKTQLSLLTRLIGEMEEVKDPAKKLPVLLFGLDSNKLGQDSFLAAAGASTQFDVEISDSKDDRPLVLSRVADQISWHIARLH